MIKPISIKLIFRVKKIVRCDDDDDKNFFSPELTKF